LQTRGLRRDLVIYGPESPAAIPADITPSAAGKKRGFCRLRL